MSGADEHGDRTGSGLAAGELQVLALRGVTWSSISSLVGLPLAIVVSVVLARTLGPEGYARFAYLTFLVPLVISLTDLGFAHAATRSVSQTFSSGKLDRTRELLGAALGWNLLRLPLLCVIVLAIARPALLGAVIVIACLVLSTAGAGLIFSLQAENRGATLARLSLAQALAVGVGTIGAALAGADATTVWAASFASGSVVAPAWLFASNPRLRRAALTPRLPRGLSTGFWRFGFVSLLSVLGGTLVFSRSEVVILEAFEEHHALAVFALAYGLSQRLTTPIDTLLGPLTTALSGLGAAHPQRLQAGFERALRLSVVACAFLAGATLVGTALLAPLMYGEDYAGVGLAFTALAAISLLQSIAQPHMALAYASGRPGVLLRALAVALVADVGVALALIPPFGLWGAVAANAVGGLTALALTIRAVAGPASLHVAEVPVPRLAAVTAASCLAAYAAGVAAGSLHEAVGVIAAFAVGTAGFAALTSAIGGLLPKTDVDAMLAILPRPLSFVSRGAALATRSEP